MRIGITTSVIQRGLSGVGRYVLEMVREYTRDNFDCEFVLYVLREDLPLFEYARERMTIVPVDEQFRPPVRNIIWHQTVLPRLALEQRLDVLHAPSYRRLVWRRPCSLVGTIHDLAPFRLSGKYDWKRTLYGRLVAKRLARRQDRIIAVSGETKKDILRFFGVREDKITVIHNGLDHTLFNPDDKDASVQYCRERFGLAQPFFLYVARLEHPGKNHVRLIQAFQQFKKATRLPWQLVLGGADWHGAEVIHRAARESTCANDIRFLGFVSDTDLPHLYRSAGVFVYPSLFEGFGMPPIEAMACGCPVICSTRGALGEVVGEAAHIIDPENVESIADGLSQLAASEALRSEASEAGFKQASRFTWKLAAQATMRVYYAACGCTSKVTAPAFQS